jgi:hypothetical protein
MYCYREPTLEEVLSDPIVRTVMQSDAVDPLELDDLLTEVARKLHAAARGKSEPAAADAGTP